VSDGGSDDGTIDIAKKLADKVIIGQKGRFRQLNAGAKEAKGDMLLFLHADTLLPKGAIYRILIEMKDPKNVGGGFKKSWNWSSQLKRSRFLKFLTFWWQGLGNWIVRLVKTFPGDNAIFVRKKVFEELNGYFPMWICEDFDFIRRMKKYGRKRVRYIRSFVYTSARRYEKYGFLKVNFTWFWIYLFYRLGMSQTGLYKHFKKYSTIPDKG
jgi:glycosyltransferase involved in cell wall biosynthesis